MLASDLALRKKGWTVVTKISVKEPQKPQLLTAKHDEFGERTCKKVFNGRGDRGMVFSIESPISFQR